MAKKVKKATLVSAVDAHNDEMKYVISTIINSITAQGQRKKLLKDERVIAILERYNISIEE